MTFKAYAQNIRIEDYDLIKAIVKVVTPESVEILDLKSYNIDIGKDDIIFTFGTRATNLCKKYECKAKLSFPEIEKLSQDLGNQEDRENAHEKLKLFKKQLHSGVFDNEHKTVITEQSLTEGILPDPKQLKTLEEILIKRNTSEWIGTTKDGRSIRLSTNLQDKIYDIEMTFAEFYALKGFMDTFNLKETKIVSTSNK